MNNTNTITHVARQAVVNADVEIESWSEALTVANREGVSVGLRELIEANLSAAIARRGFVRNVEAIERAFAAKRVANRLDRRDLHADAARQFSDLATDGRYDATECDMFGEHAAEHHNRANGKPWVAA
jgi:hypothetical protein